MDNEAPFSLRPTSQADADDLAKNGMEWIKGRLERAALHIPNVRAIMELAQDQELSAEDSYALLAYRVLVDFTIMAQDQALSAQDSVNDSRIINTPGLVIDP